MSVEKIQIHEQILQPNLVNYHSFSPFTFYFFSSMMTSVFSRMLRNAGMFLLAGVVATATLTAQPKLQIGGGGTFDWGTINDVSKPLTAKVELKNTGNQELLISEVKPGCGCTAAKPEKSKLAPNETTVIDVSLNIGANVGQLMKSVTITTNAQPDPVQTLILKANIQRPVHVEPSFVMMPPMYVGQEVSGTAKLKNNMKVPITLTSAAFNNGVKSSLKLPYTLKPEEQIDVTMTVKPTEEQKGYFNSEVVFNTDHPDQKTASVRLYGEIKVLVPVSSPAFNQQNANSGGKQ
jgi:hypothetical protein